MPVSNDENTKPDMGYHGSSMHGYSITEKGHKLDKFVQQEEMDQQDTDDGRQDS